MLFSKIVAFAFTAVSSVAVDGYVIPRQDTQTQGIASWANRAGSSSSSAPTTSVPSTTASSTPTPSGNAWTASSITKSLPLVTPTTSIPCPTTTPSATIPGTGTPCPPAKTTVPTTPCPTQSAAAGGMIVSCDGFQPWQANLAYTAGNQVIFNNQLYAAKQWTYNNSPGTSPDQWVFNGVCKQPINNKADCRGVAPWQQGQAYPGGSRVVYNGSLWVAVQWTQSNSPGDTSGTWKNVGACM